MCDCACRIILVIVNVLVGLVALGFAIFSGLLIWNRSVLDSLISHIVNPLIEKGKIQIPEAQLNVIRDYYLDLIRPIAIAIFVVSIIVMIICIIGCIGGACDVSILLKIYIGIVAVIVVVHIILLIVYAVKRKEFADLILEKYIKASNNYISFDSGQSDSLLSGLVMISEQCCGVDSGEEFRTSGLLSRTDNYGGQQFMNLLYPVACCKMTDYTISDNTCPGVFNTANSNFELGCREKVKSSALKYLDIAAYVTIGLMVAEILLIVMAAIALCC